MMWNNGIPEHTINSIRLLRVAREEPLVEHMNARDTQPLRSSEFHPGRFFMVDPLVAGTCVKEDGNHEEINSATDFFFEIRGVWEGIVFCDHWKDATDACVQVPPPTMWLYLGCDRSGRDAIDSVFEDLRMKSLYRSPSNRFCQ